MTRRTTDGELRVRQSEDARRAFPAHVDALGWPRERIDADRERRLRALLAHAQAQAPWHGLRLAGIETASFTEADLPSLPVMTKAGLMEHFDEAVCDRRLSLELAEAHLEHVAGGDEYMLGAYHVVASGGSSGRRGVFVWDWEGWVECFVGLVRRALVRPSASARRVVVTVSAEKRTHMSSAVGATFSGALVGVVGVPASLAFEEIVAGVSEAQPTILQGYPSMLHRLALESLAGRLPIAPEAVVAGSETLEPETRELMERTWNVIADNIYAISEVGCVASSCGLGPWMHLNEDLVIVEILGEDGRPVPAGMEGHRVLVTGLSNRVMPIIRYELDDRVTVLDRACPCGSAHRIIGDVGGRSSELFLVGEVVVHPIVFGGVLGRDRLIADYRVTQTVRGFDVDIVATGKLETSDVVGRLTRALRGAGVPSPDVGVRLVQTIPRTPSGKVRRYVPLSAAPTERAI